MSKLIAEFSCFISNSLWIFVQFDADLIEELTNGFKKIMEGFLPVFEVRFHVKVLNPPPPAPPHPRSRTSLTYIMQKARKNCLMKVIQGQSRFNEALYQRLFFFFRQKGLCIVLKLLVCSDIFQALLNTNHHFIFSAR